MGVEHLLCGRQVVDARAVAAIAQRHGSKDDAGDWFVFRGHAAPRVRRMSPLSLSSADHPSPIRAEAVTDSPWENLCHAPLRPVQPQEVGLVDDGHLRRVAGLRREEVAQLANISVDYLARLEQGRVTSVSAGVLHALADALGLSTDAREYLVAIAGDAGAKGSRPATHRVRPQTQQLLDSMSNVPAILLGRRLDVLAWNRMGAALLADFNAIPPAHRNLIWMTFLDPSYRAQLHDWETVARNCVAHLRMDARRYPNDSRLAALVGELSVNDDDFRAWRGSHTVRAAGHRRKYYHHPLVGDITLDSQQLDRRHHRRA
ncbi:MAG TPA: helix-turn-helix transcriptional regulator [Pseudonocardia sp.]|uniref:helix-turn-helix domain-containing protein n=1 Tax=Pseudonocardia sp. TaxID=60912 RepID=UPI002C07AD74|nr:helix-turn-helix transcriptional regulator [Pseudonocardia sp.]HTF54370.1 helix-turn-helix transcriptional regulator [Pseudonocardia sp.]